MAANFVKNDRGIGQMLVMPGMVTAMRGFAERAKPIAEGMAPVDEGYTTASGRRVPPRHPGRYKSAFSVSSGIRPRDQDPPRARVRHARAFGRLSNSAPEARFVEFGTESMQAHRVLRRAMEALRS
jgi:hypothetical protein